MPEDMGFYDRGIEFEFSEESPQHEGLGGFVPSGAVLTTLRHHLINGEIDEAMKLYESCAQDLGDDLLKGLLMESSSLVRSLARMFSGARDFKRAAICSERLGDPAKAARLNEQAGRFADAARLYLSAEQPAMAAQMYLRAGEPAEAARLYHEAGNVALAAEAHELAGDLVSAGRAYAKAGAEPRAVGMLQQVDAAHPSYVDARILLGTILARLGKLDLAGRAFVECINKAKLGNAQAAEIYYRLGHVCARLGDQPRARAAFERVQAASPGFKDVAQLLAAMEAKRQEALPAGAPSQAQAVPAATNSAGGDPVVAILEGFEHLKVMPLARDLSLDDLRLLYAQCEHARFAAGEALIVEGRPGEALFIVRGAGCQVSIGGKNVATLQPGACVGEMSMVDAGPTSATVTATAPVTAFRLTKGKFERLLQTRPGIALSVYRVFVETLVGRLRVANDRLRAAS